MSNQQGTPQTAQALPPLSTFDSLTTRYVSRQPYASRERALPVRRSTQVREQSQLGPDAIWVTTTIIVPTVSSDLRWCTSSYWRYSWAVRFSVIR